MMGLHESCSVAMADAYAQITGNAAFVSLHSAGGLGNAMGTIYTAFRNCAPLVIMAGQQTRAMLGMDPFLFAQEAASMPKPYVKWSVEPARPEDVRTRSRAPTISRCSGRTDRPSCRCRRRLGRPVPLLPARRIYADFVADPAALDALAEAFGASRSPAIVVGSGVDRDGAAALAVRFAERTGRTSIRARSRAAAAFPKIIAQFAGALPRIRTGVVGEAARARSRRRAGRAGVQLPHPRRRPVRRPRNGRVPTHRRSECGGLGRHRDVDHHEPAPRARSAAAARDVA